MTTYSDLGYATYNDYLQSPHWKHLKIRYIYKNRKARCWITGERDNLVLHHENYTHMGKERLYKDLFIVTDRLHTRLHYHLFFRTKIPLNPSSLKARRLFLKSIYCIQSFNIVLFLWYIVGSAIILSGGKRDQ